MTKNSDAFTRPAKFRRLIVDVPHRLSQEELHRLLVHYVCLTLIPQEDGELLPPDSIRATPTTQRLCFIVSHMLSLYGWLGPHGYGTAPLDPPQDAIDFADRGVKRLWDSRLIVAK